MQTILRIVIILLVAALVAAGLNLAVGGSQTSTGTTANFRDGGPTGGDHEGGEHGSSAGAGLLEVLLTLIKLSAIGALVLTVQKLISSKTNNTPQQA